MDSAKLALKAAAKHHQVPVFPRKYATLPLSLTALSGELSYPPRGAWALS